MTRTASSASALQAAWNKLAPREQTLVSAAAAVVGLALLWWLLLAPALHTLRSAHTQHAKLDAQLQHMQALASEAQQLQAQPRTSPQDAARALQASVTATLGAGAKLALSGDRATLSLVSTRGGEFPPAFDPARVVREPWGTLEFQALDADRARIQWNSVQAGYGAGAMELRRISSLYGNACG